MADGKGKNADRCTEYMSPLLVNATKIIIVNNISLPWNSTKNSCADKALIISFLMVAMHRRPHVSSLFIALS